ncbi:conserved hypothetical protein [Frankia sp. AiPs1]|uniref:hypothetical protein n=1 Tax=Frankia sp. AiPa1 TaxID=573492 RepID=UPI00202B4FEF|nr:hypothetical protein [Frankia sp. AiPa1]MCL9762768.1 hypothetical protein [Frankia sp. AiPa1]
MPDIDLIVPVQVHALVVNRAVTEQESFARWKLNFTAMLSDDRPSAEPPPGDTVDINTGVYVQWQLPEALASGLFDPEDGQTSFPLVPNRWLVVRTYEVPSGLPDEGRRHAAAWVVQSDYLRLTHGGSQRGTVQFLVKDAATGGLRADQLGRAHDLRSGGWEEPGNELFLTAAGPGIPAFAGFQPYHENVFSFYDTLEDLTGPAWPDYPGPSALSYAVIGWYSWDTADILAKAEEIPGLLPPDPADSLPPGENHPLPDDLRTAQRVLRGLRWDLPGLTDLPEDSDGKGAPKPTRSLYAGSALGIWWNYTDPERPSSDPRPDHEAQKVAFGHSTADALEALTAHQTGSRETGRLLSALYSGTIDGLDAADGEYDFDEVTRRAWFCARSGGYTWLVVPRDNGDGEPPPSTSAAPQWLDELNAFQAEYETAAQELDDAQARLRTLWWLKELPDHPDSFDAAAAQAQFNASSDTTLAYRAVTAAATMRQLVQTEGLPDGLLPADLEPQIAAYAAKVGLSDSLELRRLARGDFHSTADPAIVIAGGGLTQPLTRHPDKPLPTRLESELITAVTINGRPESPPPPQVNLAGLPAAAGPLLREFAALDLAAISIDHESNRPALEVVLEDRSLIAGTPPEYAGMWRQPWLPMYVQWDLRYHAIPYQDETGRHWAINDEGTEYAWLGTGDAPGDGIDGPSWLAFTGRALITPSAPYVAAAQIDRLLETHGATRDAGLRALRDDYRNMDLLAQTLEGFNDHLLMRDIGVRAVLPGDITPLTGDVAYVPAPADDADDSRPRFQPLRAGQLYFRDLRVIDRFGRSVVITSVPGDRFKQFTPVLADSVTPTEPLHSTDPQRFLQLPPRLLHDARLRFEVARAQDDQALPPGRATPAGTNTPIAGWLLVNHLDQNLLLYAAAGDPVGELREVGSGVTFTPLPGSAYRDETDPALRADHPHLAGFVHALVGPPARFTALLNTINHSVQSIVDPAAEDDRSPAKLIGRPLALYRARLNLELRGEPLTSQAWDQAVTPDTPEYPTYPWPIRLGDPDRLADGLIGYYASGSGPGGDTDYTQLHVTRPVCADPYLVEIGNGEGIALPATPPGSEKRIHHLTVLADPHVPVHATTHILPVIPTQLPGDLVHQALRRIRAAFRLSPLLAPVRVFEPREAPPASRTDGATEHLVVVHPAAHHGTWTWAQPYTAPGESELGWTELPLLAADQQAHLDDPVPHARAGYLLLDPPTDRDE